MFDSKSPLVKFVSYAITGFFVLIIIISFGMPDFISRMGFDQSIVAIVNGEKLNRFDFIRYRNNRFGDLSDRKMDNIILSYFIGDFLLFQEAARIGVFITNEGVKEYVLNIPGLKNPNTGKVDSERLNYFFERITSEGDIKKEMIRNKFMQFIRMGVAVSTDEVYAENKAEMSKIQLKYSYLSTMDLRNKNKNNISVSDAEISSEMEKNKKEIKDPKTDRERIRMKLENIKLDRIKKNIIDSVDALSLNNGSFEQAQALLGGVVSTSKIYKIGEKATDQKGRPLASINNSSVYLENFLGIKEGSTSRVISSESGLYIFAPVLREIKKEKPADNESQSIVKKLEEQSMMMAVGTLRQKLFENAKKIINLKTDPKE